MCVVHLHFVRALVHSFIQSSFYSCFIRLFIHSFAHRFIRSSNHSFARWFIRSFTHSFAHWFIHSSNHSFARWLFVRSPMPLFIRLFTVSQCIVAIIFHPNRLYSVLAAPPPHGSADGHTPGSPRPVNVTVPTPPEGGPE